MHNKLVMQTFDYFTNSVWSTWCNSQSEMFKKNLIGLQLKGSVTQSLIKFDSSSRHRSGAPYFNTIKSIVLASQHVDLHCLLGPFLSRQGLHSSALHKFTLKLVNGLVSCTALQWCRSIIKKIETGSSVSSIVLSGRSRGTVSFC